MVCRCEMELPLARVVDSAVTVWFICKVARRRVSPFFCHRFDVQTKEFRRGKTKEQTNARINFLMTQTKPSLDSDGQFFEILLLLPE